MTTVIYARQSLDRDGKGLAVARQLEACRSFAADQGWMVDQEMIDNDISATTGVQRPGFEALLLLRPERVVVWHIDRLVRVTRDLERVIDTGVNVHAVKAGHLDLSNPAGRAVARTVTAWATYEGEQKSLRQQAANDQRAAAGKPYVGRRCFGYTSDGMSIVESEAEHTRKAVKGILDGLPLRTVCRRMNNDGALTTAGNPWKPTELRRYLTNPRLVADRVHRGEVVGRGVWPPILTHDDHAAVCAVLRDPTKQHKGRPLTYLLSGVARCGVCGSRIYGRIERRGPIYVCESRAHLGRKCREIDDHVEAAILARLSRPDASAVFTRADQSERSATLRTEERQLTTRLDELAEAFANGHIDLRQLTTGSARLRHRLDEIAAELPALVASPTIAKLVSPNSAIAVWDTLDTETRREIVGLLAEVVIEPAGRGARVFRPDSVRITPRAGS